MCGRVDNGRATASSSAPSPDPIRYVAAMETITTGVHQISSSNVNSFIIDGDEGVTLVDTLVPGKRKVIAAGLAKIGRSVEDVTAIVLTHSHFDHTGSGAPLQLASGASVYASEADAPAIRGHERPPAPPISDIVIPLKWMMRILPGAKPMAVTHLVAENKAAGLPEDLRAIDTPGHTPGHTSFLLSREGGVLFAGDAARATRKGAITRGWFNRATPQVDASLRHLAELDFEIACFGHAPPLTTGAADAFRRFADSLA